MAHTLDRCEHDSIKWFPRVTVEKYSPDQSAYAERRLHEELSWGRRLLVDRLGIRVPRLHGDWLRQELGEPEDGYASCQGNSMVNGGLDALTAQLTATSPSGLLTPAKSICGVGSNAGAMVTGSAALLSDTGSCWYQQMDALYPAVDGTTHGQLDGQSTFTSTSANGWSWVEWCWASTTSGTITGGATLSGVSSGTETMFNRWSGTSLGTKGAGASWVFSSTISFSL